MNADAHNFRSALIQWRFANATAALGEDIVHAYGAKAFMTDDIVVRIVACAALGKLTTPELLDKEIGWDIDWAAQYKVNLLGFIHRHFPPTVSHKELVPTGASRPPSRPALAVNGVSEVSADNVKPRKLLRCSRCNGEGHMSKFALAPSYCSLTSRITKETNRKCPLYRQERFAKVMSSATSTMSADKENITPARPSSCPNGVVPSQSTTTTTVTPYPHHLDNNTTSQPHIYPQPSRAPALASLSTPVFMHTPQTTPLAYNSTHFPLVYLSPREYYSIYSPSTLPPPAFPNYSSTNTYTSNPPSS